MTQFSDLGCVVIGLERDRPRQEHLLGQLSALGVADVHVIAAVDGEKLAGRQGRVRRKGPRQLRLSYNTEEGGRAQMMLHLPRRNATLNPWSILGCSLSHALALEHVKARFAQGRREPMVVFEDDARLAKGVQETIAAFSGAMARLRASVPTWALVHLGGARVDSYAKHTRNRASAVEGLGVSEAIWQTHAYMISAAGAAALDHVIGKLQNGFPSDASLASWTRNHYEVCFYFQPFLFVQCAHASSIKPLSDPCPPARMHGNRALVQTARRLMGPAAFKTMKTSGLPKIVGATTSSLRSSSGRNGGVKKAGGKSSATVVRRKEAWIRRQRKTTGTWPSSHAAKQQGISHGIWKRVVDAP